MYKVIIAQHYFEKDKSKGEGSTPEFKGYVGMAEFFSDYTKKLYNTLNQLMLKTKIDRDLNKLNQFLVNEIFFEFSSTIEELNTEKDEEISIEELLKKEELLLNLKSVECRFISELDPKFATDDLKKIILMFQLSVRKDFAALLKKEKDISLSFSHVNSNSINNENEEV